MHRRLFVLSLAAVAVGTDSFVIAGVLPDVSASLRVARPERDRAAAGVGTA